MSRIDVLAPLLATFALVSSTTACVVYDDGYDDVVVIRDQPPVVIVESPANYRPEVTFGDVGCDYDPSYHDFYWWFDSDVYDGDGPQDVIGVWADVYDEWDGSFVDSFELLPTNDPWTWYVDYNQYDTYLDCYYDAYSVDIVVYDTFEDWNAITVFPNQY